VIFRFSEGDIFFDEVNRRGFLSFLKKREKGFIVSCCQVMLGILRKGFEQFVALFLPDAMRSQRMPF